MGEVELSCRAYVKMYLHCCLFPRCSVNGLLLSSSSSTGGAVCVTDAVPLLHSHLPLAPITQLALTQVGRDGRLLVNSVAVVKIATYTHRVIMHHCSLTCTSLATAG